MSRPSRAPILLVMLLATVACTTAGTPSGIGVASPGETVAATPTSGPSVIMLTTKRPAYGESSDMRSVAIAR